MTLSGETHRLDVTVAPVVPGGGPRWRGELAARRARARGWIRWWWASAGLGVLGIVPFVAAFLVADNSNPFLAWFGCWIAAILCMVPGHRKGWVQRHDRYDDELSTYSTGVRAEMSLRTRDGVVRLGERIVGTSSEDAAGRRRVETDAGVFTLQERVLQRAGDGRIDAVAVRLVDEAGVVAASAHGERRGDRVDWTLALPLGELRLRQDLRAVPSRRTVLDDGGRAWRIRGDADAPCWWAELPDDAGVVDAVFVTWFACHLDAVGLERCYAAENGDGPALSTRDGVRLPAGDAAPWAPVGAPGARPGVPTASGQGFDIDL